MVGGLFDGTHNAASSDIFINIDYFDFPMESLEGDDLDEGHQDTKVQGLGPIPSEALLGSSSASGGNIRNAVPILMPSLSGPASAPSPVSVLDSSSSSSCSSKKSVSMSSDSLTPARTGSMHPQVSTISPCLLMPSISPTTKISHRFLTNSITNPVKRKPKKEKKLSELSGADEMIENSSQQPVATKRCLHCNVSNTPQWREGPMGPKTLCNACGVRYRAGHLLPEYRPAMSPTFVPSLHSNVHKTVVQMRNKAIQEVAMAETKPPISPPHKAFHEAAIAETKPPISPPHKAFDEAARAEIEPPMPPPHKAILEAPMTEIEAEIEPPMAPPHKAILEAPMTEIEIPIYPLLKKEKLSCATEMGQNSTQQREATKRCLHCEVRKTPQWRDGPMGPKTLCNACGVRYRAGRLLPDYRPAASPTFVPHLHSNSHRKIVEMTNKVTQGPPMEIETPMSPPAKKKNPSGDTVMMQNSLRRRVSTKKCSHCEETHLSRCRRGPMGTKTLCNKPVATELTRNCSPPPSVTKKCSHCEVTKTPQWREGPMGPKTLCNACGVRYRSRRLFPEYRPASSPTFVPSLHSNSHREVLKMRNRATQEAVFADTDPPTSPHEPNKEKATAEVEPPISPPPEFIPMSSYLIDCILEGSGQYS